MLLRLVPMLLLCGALMSGEPPPAFKHDWAVAYWMCYDNGLDPAGEVILKMIAQGFKEKPAPNVAVAIQADFKDAKGMRRYVYCGASVEESAVDSEDSADEKQLTDFLEWFAAQHPARRFILVLLDHGGRLDEMCLDENPAAAEKHWMSGRALGERLRAFKPKLPGRWELFFIQQCGRGTLENLYHIRGTAGHLLCSPVRVGTPNRYYAALHQFLAGKPEATGAEAAAKIAAADRDYAVFTLVRAAKLPEVPARLDRALAPLLAGELPPVSLPRVIYSEDDEQNRDLRAFLQVLAEAQPAGKEAVAEFVTWLREELCPEVYYHPRLKELKAEESLSGLAVFVPANREQAERYRDLDLYQAAKLGELWKKLPNSQAVKKPR
jgi:hypothetical protein